MIGTLLCTLVLALGNRMPVMAEEAVDVQQTETAAVVEMDSAQETETVNEHELVSEGQKAADTLN